MSTPGAIAVIFAGGIGSRMRSAEQPKQFLPVQGKPVLVHTLEHFQSHEEIAAVYLSCVASHIDEAWSLVHRFGLGKVRRIVAGGGSAQESIYSGLRSAREDSVADDTVVLVHDGVRPLINADLISRNIETARLHGTAVTAIPCFETIARSVDGARSIDSVTQREEMHVLQAPQTFLLGQVLQANAWADEQGSLGACVDQAQLMERYGEKVRLVQGLRGNVKLTTDLDLLQFTLLAESGQLVSVIGEKA